MFHESSTLTVQTTSRHRLYILCRHQTSNQQALVRTKTIPADLYNVSIHLFNCPAFSKVPAKKKKGVPSALNQYWPGRNHLIVYLNQSDRTRKVAHYDYGDPGNQSPPSRCFPTTQKKSFWCCQSYHQSASQYQLKTRIIRNDCEMWYKKKQTTFLFRVPFNWLSNQRFSKRNHCEQAPLYPKCI